MCALSACWSMSFEAATLLVDFRSTLGAETVAVGVRCTFFFLAAAADDDDDDDDDSACCFDGEPKIFLYSRDISMAPLDLPLQCLRFKLSDMDID